MLRDEYAKAIESNRTYLTELWESAVRQDPRIVSDDGLSVGELRDAIPTVIAEIAEAVSSGEAPTVVSGREARVHVYMRYRQGYRARDVVRELSLLRLVLLDFLTAASSERVAPSSFAEFAEAARIICLFVDEEMRYAMTIYTESSPRNVDDVL